MDPIDFLIEDHSIRFTPPASKTLPAAVLKTIEIIKGSYTIWNLINRIRVYFFGTKLTEDANKIIYLVNRDLFKFGIDKTELNAKTSDRERITKVATQIFKFIEEQIKELLIKEKSAAFVQRFKKRLSRFTIQLNSECEFRNYLIGFFGKIQDLMAVIPHYPPATLKEAVSSWNKEHPHNSLLRNGLFETRELGRTIFVNYSKKKGYWLEKLNKEEADGKTSYCYDESQLTPHQINEIRSFEDWCKLFNIVHQPTQGKSSEEIWEINLAKIEAVFGPEVAEAYFAVMHCDARNRRNEIFPRSKEATEKLSQILPKLEQIVKTVSEKMKVLNINIFIPIAILVFNFCERAKAEIREYSYESFLKRLLEASGDSDPYTQELFEDRIRKAFALFTGKVIDSYEIYTQWIEASVLGIIEGTDCSAGTTSLCDDIKAFRKTLKEENPVIEKVLAILELADELSFHSQTIFTISKTAKVIVEELKQLANQESILIPGGYPGHGFLYQLTKTNEKFSFTIIDTGGTFPIKKYWFNINDVTAIKEHHFKKDPFYVNATTDCVFTEIPVEDLTPEFFVNLWKVSMETTTTKTGEICDFLESSFGKKRTFENRTRQQFLGTCATQPKLQWLLKQLPKKIKYQFENFMIARAMHLVEIEFNALTDLSRRVVFMDKPLEEILAIFRRISAYRIKLNNYALDDVISLPF